MSRLRRDFQAGTLTAGTTDSATTITSAAFAGLPEVVSPDYLIIVLDPTAVAGEPETVKVTAHTAASTTVTVSRGEDDTTQRAHLTGTIWRHGPVASDYTAPEFYPGRYSSLQACLDAAASAAADSGGGAIVNLGGDVISTAEVTIAESVHLIRGTLRLPNGADTFLLQSEFFESLTGTAESAAPSQFGLRDLFIDGNKAHNSPTEPLIKLYGYDFELSRVRIRNAGADGLWAEWGTDAGDPGPDSMEAVLRNVKVHDCDGDGIVWKGPHDSMWSHVITYSNNGIGMNIVPDGGALVMDACHSWGLEQSVAMYFGANVLAMNCHAEGGIDANVVMAANDCQYYGSVDAARTTGSGLQGIQIGTVSTEVAGSVVNAFVGNCLGGAIQYVNDGGSRVEVNVYTVTPVAAAVGSRNGGTTQIITGNATDAGMLFPGKTFFGAQMVVETADGTSLSVRRLSDDYAGDKRVRQDFTVNGIDQYAWIVDRDQDGDHNFNLYDPVAGTHRIRVEDDGLVYIPGETVLGDDATVTGDLFVLGGKVVSAAPADSAGAGFRHLIVPN